MFVVVTLEAMGELEDLERHRRSLAMLSPGVSSGLSREDAIGLLEQLQSAHRRIVELERAVHAAAVLRHPAAGR